MKVMGNTQEKKNPIDVDISSGEGPCGKGDPEDFSLRDREIFLNIPKYQWKAAERVKCASLQEIYNECAEDAFVPMFGCSNEMNQLVACVQRWAHDAEYRKEITEEYLMVRQEFRKTGRRRLYRGLKGETYVTEDQLKGFQA